MKEIYSKEEDCQELKAKLYEAFGQRVSMRGYEIVEGEYHSFPWSTYENHQAYKEDQIRFYYKFRKNGFLRIDVENGGFPVSNGHKLAVLSDFYEALLDEFGEPTVFYTLKNDQEGGFHFQWAFIQKEETIEEFTHGFPFDDEEVDQAIVIGRDTSLNQETRNLFSHQMGFPIELLPFINENIEDYMKYKYGPAKSNEKKNSSSGYQKTIS